MYQDETVEKEPGRYIEANGLNIHYDEQGEGSPLVLLHGGTGSLGNWYEHLPTFAEHFRVIMLDSRGHGQTRNPASELGYDMMADDVAAFAKALDLSKPLILGYSDGGQIALELGMRHPDLAGALVLGGTCYRFGKQYFEALEGFGIHNPAVFDVGEMEKAAPEWVEALKVEHARPDDPENWRTLMKQISALWWDVHDYSAADLAKITAPTLILVGDRDEGVDPEQSVEMYRMIPNAELAIMPNANHGTAFGPLSWAVVLDFLKRQSWESAEE